MCHSWVILSRKTKTDLPPQTPSFHYLLAQPCKKNQNYVRLHYTRKFILTLSQNSKSLFVTFTFLFRILWWWKVLSITTKGGLLGIVEQTKIWNIHRQQRTLDFYYLSLYKWIRYQTAVISSLRWFTKRDATRPF